MGEEPLANTGQLETCRLSARWRLVQPLSLDTRWVGRKTEQFLYRAIEHSGEPQGYSSIWDVVPGLNGTHSLPAETTTGGQRLLIEASDLPPAPHLIV
jgi:hypothetical protein